MAAAKSIGVVDYGAGNLFSVERGLRAAGCAANFIADPERVAKADVLVLPGVGAFGAGMERLRATGMDSAIVEFVRSGRPLLGVCLGMQLLMSHSSEFGEHAGLGFIAGGVVELPHRAGWPVPNIGWCSVQMRREPAGTPFTQTATGDDFYFVHSFHCVPKDGHDLLGTIEYDDMHIAAIISRDNVHGCQFHPEISAQAGVRIYHMLEQAT